MIKIKRFEINIDLTFSKFYSILLLIAAVWTSLSLEAPEIMLIVAPIVGAVIAHKQHADRKIKEKNDLQSNS